MSSDRFSGRVESPSRSDQSPQAPRGPSAKESHRSRKDAAARVTDASVRRLQAKLTNTDRQVVDSLNTVRIATGAQLRRLHWADTESGRRLARHHLKKLTDLRIIVRLDRRIGGIRAGSDGFTYSLDVAGLRLVDDSPAGRRRRPSTPGDRYLDHALATTDCYVTLRHLEATTEVELLAFQSEPASWRTYSGPGGAGLTLKPDAFALLADTTWEHRWFLEIDRDTEHRPALLRKLHDYIAYWNSGTEQHLHDLFPKVLWLTPTERRAEDLRQLITGLDLSVQHLFEVCPCDDLEPTLIRAAQSSEAAS